MGGAELPARAVTFRAPTVDAVHRNFEFEVRVEDPPPGLVPGRMVQLAVVFEARQALGVPRGAVVRRGGESVVFVVDDNDRARAVPVTVGLLTDGLVEVTSDALAPGDAIVVEGQDWLDAGALVRRVEEN
jgi:multidrug efflux pump subunit AcrA (membrane-fusion protein)